MQKKEQLRKLIESKISRLEYMQKQGSYSRQLEDEIKFLADIYTDINSGLSKKSILDVKSFSDKVDFLINKEFNLNKAVKKYAQELVINLKASQ